MGAAAVAVTVTAGWGGAGLGARPAPPVAGASAAPSKAGFTAPGLYPPFHPARRDYVARCTRRPFRATVSAGATTRVAVAGSRPRSGRFSSPVAVRPGEDFAVRVSRPAGSTTYRVRCLPAKFPSWRFQRLRRIPRGLFAVGSKGSRGRPPFVAIFDHRGMPRWWYRPRTTALNVQVLRNGTVAWSRSFGDGYGRDRRMAHEVHALSGRLIRLIRTRGSITDPHELYELPNRNVLLDSYIQHRVNLRPYGGPRRAAIVFAHIQEQTPSRRVVWRWNSLRRISLDETNPRWWRILLSNPRRRPGGPPTYDAIHINSIEPWGKQIVISTRHSDAVFGIDRATGKVRWKLGGTRTPQSLKVIGDPHARQPFGGQHDARLYKGGRISIFDNATNRPRPPRGVIYRLDLVHRRARMVRQFIDRQARASRCCGSMRAIRGGWLIDFGNDALITAFNRRGRVAFRLRFAKSYRAVPVQGRRVTLRELARGLEAQEARRARRG